MIEFMYSAHITVQDLTLQNSVSWVGLGWVGSLACCVTFYLCVSCVVLWYVFAGFLDCAPLCQQ